MFYMGMEIMGKISCGTVGNFLDIPLIKKNADVIRTEEGGIYMCTAFQQMRMEGVREGIRASFDTEYREKLYKEYGLENENL